MNEDNGQQKYYCATKILKTLREISVCYLGLLFWRGSCFYLKGFLSKDGGDLDKAVISGSYKFLLISSVLNVIEVSVSWSSFYKKVPPLQLLLQIRWEHLLYSVEMTTFSQSRFLSRNAAKVCLLHDVQCFLQLISHSFLYCFCHTLSLYKKKKTILLLVHTPCDTSLRDSS